MRVIAVVQPTFLEDGHVTYRSPPHRWLPSPGPKVGRGRLKGLRSPVANVAPGEWCTQCIAIENPSFLWISFGSSKIVSMQNLLGKSWLQKFSGTSGRSCLCDPASFSCRPVSQDVYMWGNVWTWRLRWNVHFQVMYGVVWHGVWLSQSSEPKTDKSKYLGNDVYLFRQEALRPWEIQYRVSKEGDDKQAV